MAEAAHSHDAISEVAVVGVADARLGQVPAAVIVLRQDKPPVEVTALEAHLRDTVLATHVPVAWRFVGELSRTSSMKVDHRAVRRLFENPATDLDSGARNGG